jgi:TorA maturation chaperone TorD
MTIDQQPKKQVRRAQSYKLLSECYYPPDEELIIRLNRLSDSTVNPCLEISNYVPKIDELESLAIDFSRLFLGPYKLLAAPYGSVYLEDGRCVMGESTVEVRNWYRKEGLDVVLKEVPDHIAVELEFMYFLIFKETEAIRNSDPEGVANYLKKQMSFLQDHLGRWVPEFAGNVEANAQTQFYKNLARLTRSFIKEDLRNLSAELLPILRCAS